MKTVLIVLVLLDFWIHIACGLNLIQEFNIIKKVENQHCPSFTCVGEGKTCLSSDCQPCYDKLHSCYSQEDDLPEKCSCINVALSCLAQKPLCNTIGNSPKSECLKYFAGMNYECNCGQNVIPTSGPVCDVRQYCGADFKCMPRMGENSSCSLDYACQSYMCQEGTCKEPKYKNRAPGDSCILDGDCKSRNCVNGLCIGRAIDERCVDDFSCAFELYCNGTSCQPRKEIGEDCTYNNCVQDAVCGFNHECVKMHSQSNGGSCMNDFECQLDLHCTANGCDYYTPKECNLDTDCESGICMCQKDGSSICFPPVIPECSGQLQKFYDCGLQNKCFITDVFQSKEYCMTKQCPTESRCLESCLIQYHPIFKATCYSYDIDDTGCSERSKPSGEHKHLFPPGAIAAIVIIVLLFFASAAGIIYYCTRDRFTKKDYALLTDPDDPSITMHKLDTLSSSP